MDRRRILDLIGLAARAGRVAFGTERVREAVRQGAARYVIIAADAAEGARDKLLPLLRARGVDHAIEFERWELGRALGRGPLSAVALLAGPLAERVQALVARGVSDVDSRREESDRGSGERRRER